MPSVFQLLWTIAPKDEHSAQQLRDKVAAKMTVAGIFCAVIVAALVVVVDGLFRDPTAGMAVPRYFAAGLLFLGAVLSFMTVLYCDRLLMPIRFWGQPKSMDLADRPEWLIWRPPGADDWVIYQNMIRVWHWFFVPAGFFVGVATLLLGVALFSPQNTIQVILCLLLFIGGPALLIAYC